MSGYEVACITTSPTLLARLRSAVGKSGRVREFGRYETALPLIVRGEIDATFVTFESHNTEEVLRALKQLRAARPTHALVAWCDLKSPPTRLLVDIAQASPQEMVLRGVDDSPYGLAATLATAVKRASTMVIQERLLPLIPIPVQSVFIFALEHAHEPLTVEQVAASFGVTRRTLCNRLAQYRLPRPRVFLTWCRLLVAGALLDERSRSLDEVAGQLDFPTGHGLGMALRRHLGSGISVLRDGHVSAAIEHAFREALRNASAGSLPLESSAD